MTEMGMAKDVVRWLEAEGWDVYQEVRAFSGGSIADIVATCGPKLWVVETKTSYGLAVLDQALRWKAFAHAVSVAVPQSRRGAHRYFANHIHRTTGIGLMRVGPGGDVYTTYAPDFVRCPSLAPCLRGALRPEQKYYAPAGSNAGGFYSPFAASQRSFVESVRRAPGRRMKDIIDELGQLHYASSATARCALAKWVRLGRIRGVEKRADNRYYPV